MATSYTRFNTPPTNRSSTTWVRYHALACVYTLALVAAWVILANAPEVLGPLASTADLTNGVRLLDAPVYAAVLLTVLPNVPPFSGFDVRIRAFFQDLARIPWEAQRLSAALRARTWLPSEEFEDRIRKALKDADFSPADISFSSDRTPQAVWTRITALQKYIDGWETRSGKFAGFYFGQITAVRQLRDDYERMAAKARRVFSMLKGRSAAVRTGESDTLQEEFEQGFLMAAERLEQDLCDFVSSGVLTCGLTARARRTEFETIGFMVNVTPSHLFDNMLGLYLFLAALYVTEFVFLKRPNPWLTGLEIATIYVGAMVVTFEVKRWLSVQPDGEELPITGYALSAVAAFGFAMATSFVLGILLTFDVAEAGTLLISKWWPWGFMSAALAGFVAFLIDQDNEPGRRRWEAGAVALACAVVAIPVVFLLNQACPEPACSVPPVWRVMINAFITGAAIGYFVPTWYRRPQIMVSEYEHFRIQVTAHTNADSRMVATIEVTPPKTRSDPKPAATQLPDEVESESADDAIGEAIRRARTWIDQARASVRSVAA